MLMFRVSVHTAIGTAPVFGVLIAFFGALGSIIIGGKQQGLPPWSLGYVNLAGLILMAPAGYIAAPVGAKLIHRMPVEKLQRLFAGILFMVAAWLFYELITLNG